MCKWSRGPSRTTVSSNMGPEDLAVGQRVPFCVENVSGHVPGHGDCKTVHKCVLLALTPKSLVQWNSWRQTKYPTSKTCSCPKYPSKLSWRTIHLFTTAVGKTEPSKGSSQKFSDHVSKFSSTISESRSMAGNCVEHHQCPKSSTTKHSCSSLQSNTGVLSNPSYGIYFPHSI